MLILCYTDSTVSALTKDESVFKMYIVQLICNWVSLQICIPQITHYAVEKWGSYQSTWMPVEPVPSDKTSCALSHLTEGQKIFLRILAGNVAGQSKPPEGETPLVPFFPYSKWTIDQSLNSFS